MVPSVFVFLFLYIFSFIIVMGMEDWFMIWFGLEMNMMSFLVLIYQSKSLLNIESCLKYFFIQSLSSAVLVGGYYLMEGMFELMCCLILVMKMGGGPFFFWFPSVCNGIGWASCFMLMIFQKILPLILLMETLNWCVWFMILLSLMIGVWGSFNQLNVKYLMAFSSVHQIGWILLCLYVGEVVWVIYLILYSFVLFISILKFYMYDIINFSMVVGMKYKLWMLFVMMNLGGVPPLLGFVMKWFGFYNFMFLNNFMLFFMILMSVVMLYVYLRLCYSMMLGGEVKMSWEFGKNYIENGKMMEGVIETLFLLLGCFGSILIFFY